MKRIAHVIPDIGPGGAERMCVDLAKTQAKGNRLAIVVIGKRTDSAVESDAERSLNVVFAGKSRGFRPFYLYTIFKEIRRLQPDVVHSHRACLKYLLLAILFLRPRTRFIHTLHNEPKLEATRLDRLLNRVLFKSGLVQPVALSSRLARQASLYYSLPRMPWVLNGVPMQSVGGRHKQSRSSELVWIGRMEPQKDPLLFLDALQRLEGAQDLPPWHATMIGDGSLLSCVRARIEASPWLRGRVAAVGNMPSARALLARAGILVMSSRWEGVPLVILEAFAEGVPVIATAVGGIPDLLDQGRGVLVDTSPQEIGDAIERLLTDYSFRERLVTAASKDLSVFSSDYMARRYLEVYEGVIE